jgi:hypothetical protein
MSQKSQVQERLLNDGTMVKKTGRPAWGRVAYTRFRHDHQLNLPVGEPELLYKAPFPLVWLSKGPFDLALKGYSNRLSKAHLTEGLASCLLSDTKTASEKDPIQLWCADDTRFI